MVTTDTALAAIRQLVADAEQHQLDPDAFIPLHTEDLVLVNIAGRRVFGRDALDKIYRSALASPLASVLTRTEVEDIRFLHPDVAIVSLTKHVSDSREQGQALPERGCLTYVVTKQNGAWRIALAQTTPIAD